MWSFKIEHFPPLVRTLAHYSYTQDPLPKTKACSFCPCCCWQNSNATKLHDSHLWPVSLPPTLIESTVSCCCSCFDRLQFLAECTETAKRSRWFGAASRSRSHSPNSAIADCNMARNTASYTVITLLHRSVVIGCRLGVSHKWTS